MRFLKLFFSRFIIVALLILIQLAFYFGVWFYLEQKYIAVQIIGYILAVLVGVSILGRNQSAAYKLPWIVIILLFPLAGVFLLLAFGRVKLTKKQTQRFKDVYEVTQNAVSEPSEELTSSQAYGQSSYILNTCHLPAFNNTYNEYLPTGEIYFARLKEEIQKASKYIFMEYFIVEYGQIWDEIHEILLEKVKSGVKVYFMYDDIGSISKVRYNFHRKLREEGINAVVFSRFFPLAAAFHNNRDHRKITVIDGEVAFTGGINLADEYANIKEVFGKWKDSGIILKGQAVDSFVALFLQNYNVMTSKQIQIDDYICKNHQVYEETGFVQPYGDGPRPISEDYVGRDIYLNIINQSRHYLYITTPYLIVEYSIIELLCNAAKRGVDVRIITPHIPDKKTIFLMTRSSYEPLLKAGVKIYEYKPGFIHAKTFLCDDLYGVVGTVNLDYRSFVHHYECGVWMYKTSALKTMKADFNKMIKQDTIVMDLKNSHLKFIQRFIKNVLNLFAPLL